MEPFHSLHQWSGHGRLPSRYANATAGRPPHGSHPTVLAAAPAQELRWLGQLGVPGLFDGEHGFRIESMGTNRVRFIQDERFSGLLAPLVLHVIGRSTRQGFEAMNVALKARAEMPSPSD